MSITFAPFETYADVTGVVDATAAAEVVALGVLLKALFKDSAAYDAIETAGTSHTSAASPDFDQIPRHVADKINAEIDGVLAAIAAAPTS